MKKLLWLLVFGLMSSNIAFASRFAKDFVNTPVDNYYSTHEEPEDEEYTYSRFNPYGWFAGNPKVSKVKEESSFDLDEDYYPESDDMDDQDAASNDVEEDYDDEEDTEDYDQEELVEEQPVQPTLITRLKNVVTGNVAPVASVRSVNPANVQVVAALTELNTLARNNSIGKLSELAQDSLNEFSKNAQASVSMVTGCMESAARFISDHALTDMNSVDNAVVARMQELIATVQSSLPSVS